MGRAAGTASVPPVSTRTPVTPRAGRSALEGETDALARLVGAARDRAWHHPELDRQAAALAVEHAQRGRTAGREQQLGVDHRTLGDRERVEHREMRGARTVVARVVAAVREVLDGAAADVVAELRDLVEAREHLAVDGVDRAAADRVVRVVQQERAPGHVEQRPRVGTAGAQRERGERLGVALEQRLGAVVRLLQVHAGREDACEDVLVAAAAELAAVRGEIGALGLRRPHELLDVGVDHVDVGVGAGEVAHDGGHVGLGEEVIGAVEQQQRPPGGVGVDAALEALHRLAEPDRELLAQVAAAVEHGRELPPGTLGVVGVAQLPVVVSDAGGRRVRAEQVDGEHPGGAVRGLPRELAAQPFALVADAALEDDRVEPKPRTMSGSCDTCPNESGVYATGIGVPKRRHVAWPSARLRIKASGLTRNSSASTYQGPIRGGRRGPAP
jgi:hypothetical protein